MEIGRLYSRICGWENGAPVKYYNSAIIIFIPKDIFDTDEKTGGYIIIHEYVNFKNHNKSLLCFSIVDFF